MVYISSKSEVFQFSEGQKPPIRVAYNNQKTEILGISLI